MSLFCSDESSWEGELLFDPDAVGGTNVYRCHQRNLHLKFQELSDQGLVDLEETIKTCSVFTCDIHGYQELVYSSSIRIRHAFVIIETNDWFWSIEKHNEGISIQRSKSFDHLKNINQGVKRRDVLEIKSQLESTKKRAMKGFIFNFTHEELGKEYSLLTKNCFVFVSEMTGYLSSDPQMDIPTHVR